MNTALVAALTAIVGSLTALIVDWIGADAKQKSLLRSIQEGAKATELLESWSKAIGLVESIKEEETRQLARGYAQEVMRQAHTSLVRAPEVRTASAVGERSVRWLLRITTVLRLRTPLHPALWIPQLGFYVFFGWTWAVIVDAIRSRPDVPADLLAIAIPAVVATGLWIVCAVVENRLVKTRTEISVAPTAAHHV